MDWEELRGQEGAIIKWLEKYSAVTLVSEGKRMVEEVREIFKDKNMNMSALVLKSYRVEELVMRCVHQLTRESRLDELEDALTRLPDLMFATCIPNLSYAELTHHFPSTLPLCSRLLSRLHKSRHRHNLPIPLIDTMLYQLCLWMFSSTLQEQNYSQYISEIRECISAIQLLEPNFLARVEKKREEINAILDAMQILPGKSPNVLIEDAILKEVNSNLDLLNSASSKLRELSQQEIISIGQMLHEGLRPSFLCTDDDSGMESPLTYTQLEERISFSFSLMTAVKPVMSMMKEDKLSVLLQTLKCRVDSDKSAVALIDKLSTLSFETLLQDESVEFILQRYNQGMEILFSVLSDTDPTGNGGKDKDSEYEIAPELFTHQQAFQSPTSVAAQDEHSTYSNPITSTPLHEPSSLPYLPSLPSLSTDEIRVIHTPELQLATLLHSLPNSPSQLTQLDAQYILAASPSSNDTSLQSRVEIDRLREIILKLEGKLTKSKSSLTKLNSRERELKKRVSELSKKQVIQDTHQEEMYLIQYRRSQVVLRYSDLYSHERMDCLDALRTLAISPDRSYVILFSVLKISYQIAELEDEHIKLQWKSMLQATDKSTIATQSIEDSVYAYLRKENAILPSLKPVFVSKVKARMAANFSELSIDILSHSQPILNYIIVCIDLCWSMLIQSPKLYIEFGGNKFISRTHKRFFTSSERSQTIKYFVWPALLERDTQRILCKGLVVT